MNDDELGWRGQGPEAHLSLTAEQDRLVRDLWDRAAQARPALDGTMRLLRDQSAERGSALVGDEKANGIEEVGHSLKGLDSLRRKVAVDVSRGADVGRVLGRVNDLNRYTLTFEPENYAQATQETYGRLKALGYEPVPGSEKNTWQDPAYKGINTTWQQQESGQRFELQFHTPDSFQAKTDNHELYEIARSGHFEQMSAGQPERARQYHQAADLLQNERYRNVVVPTGNEAIGEQKIRTVLKPEVPVERVQEVRAAEAKLKERNAGKAAERTALPQRAERESGRGQDGRSAGVQSRLDALRAKSERPSQAQGRSTAQTRQNKAPAQNQHRDTQRDPRRAGRQQGPER
ncbi:hypothetical protein NX794_23570 [Streptomyces sp. LP11]|uniref:Uncharacterized protein n=1 Tax=Streptomyces pyxinicus TaxID=2970331 RepID=A0ABT2B6M3_9ACTN|nr:hypothetical protein [Streptomyces sp. LP11]MCS0604169.1 hypothetical protein [Streptomyces sp. LP11]